LFDDSARADRRYYPVTATLSRRSDYGQESQFAPELLTLFEFRARVSGVLQARADSCR
jgi:hypothetical protein